MGLLAPGHRYSDRGHGRAIKTRLVSRRGHRCARLLQTRHYVSGHSIEGGAGAEVLKQFVGTDDITLQDCSVTLPAGSTCSDATPVFRSYTSFSQAAAENAYRASSVDAALFKSGT